MFIELLSVKVLWLCCDTWGVACEPDAPINSKSSSSISGSQDSHPPGTSPPQCCCATFLGYWDQCSTAGCKPSSVGQLKPSTTSSVTICFKHVSHVYQHLVCTLQLGNYFIHRLSTHQIQWLYHHAVRTWYISLYAISGFGYFPSVHSPQATAEDIETFISPLMDYRHPAC